MLQVLDVFKEKLQRLGTKNGTKDKGRTSLLAIIYSITSKLKANIGVLETVKFRQSYILG